MNSKEELDKAIEIKSTGEKSSLPVPEVEGVHILLVEDNTLNQQLAVDFLNKIGFKTTVANDGREALDILENEQFDVILMDCQMPVMDGYEATRKIREQEKFKELPIIALTAGAMQEDIEMTLLAGMNDHIIKPIDPTAMYQTIAKWISSSTLKSPLVPKADKANDGKIDIPDIEGIDIKKGLITTNGNKKLYLKLLKKFITNQSDFTRQFQLAFQTENLQVAIRAVHTLKGLAGSIGAGELQEAALVLEKSVKNRDSVTLIEQNFVNVVRLLDLLLTELTTKTQEHDVIEQPQIETSQDTDTLKPRLKELRELILEYDTSAINILEELSIFKGDALYSNYINAISQALEEYNFDGALEKLDAFLSEIN